MLHMNYHSDLGLSVRAHPFKNVFELFHVKTSLNVGAHDPNYGANYYSDCGKLMTRIKISLSRNNATKIIGSKKWIVWTDP